MKRFFQMTEITAEEVKCSCINAIRDRESGIHFYWFRKKILLAQCYRMLQLTKNMFTQI